MFLRSSILIQQHGYMVLTFDFNVRMNAVYLVRVDPILQIKRMKVVGNKKFLKKCTLEMRKNCTFLIIKD